ncbi:MAG TPA: RRXRR domain-containing protein [Fervidobacterium sp.]|nr:RRXRR domain-containing protein [Fervidobacterium sp.]
MVYVLSVEGKPLMPTKRHGKVRRLLKQHLAKVVKTKPFTIQLLYETTSYTQNITLGIDSGYNYIGFSAVTEKEELICGEVKLRDDISELLKESWNVREYVLYRDNYTCQLCGKKNTILEVHHIGYWKQDRTDRPGNLITLCAKCHNSNNHKDGGKLYGMKPVQKPLKDATFMSTIRWKLVNTLMCGYTYGYITKSKRVSLGLEKTHYNDAFCIAGGINQQRIEPIYFEQNRRNNRSLEKFYDAKYVDIRDKTIKTGQELFCGRRTRNKNLSAENLRKYRGAKVSKGRRNIRKQRYEYQPKDIVIFEGEKYTVQGVQNKGEYIKLTEKSKPVKTNIVKPYMFRKGFSVVYNCNSSPTCRSGSLLAGK